MELFTAAQVKEDLQHVEDHYNLSPNRLREIRRYIAALEESASSLLLLEQLLKSGWHIIGGGKSPVFGDETIEITLGNYRDESDYEVSGRGSSLSEVIKLAHQKVTDNSKESD